MAAVVVAERDAILHTTTHSLCVMCSVCICKNQVFEEISKSLVLVLSEFSAQSMLVLIVTCYEAFDFADL